jgi:hypothetical protein
MKIGEVVLTYPAQRIAYFIGKQQVPCVEVR